LENKTEAGTIDYSFKEYFVKPGIREKFWVANLMQISRHLLGSTIHIIFLFLMLARL
jgi:hypothetical protein